LKSDPDFKSAIGKSGLAGPDQKYFTMDDGLNVTSGSPAIDKGELIPFMDFDIIGKMRKLGMATDIGAYEN